MKAHLCSDLHIDFGDLVLPGGAELLIVAGDLCEAASFGRNDGGKARQMATACRRFVNEELTKYPEVVFVPGNHEYYGRTIGETHRLLELNMPKHVTMLQDSFKIYGTLTIYGTTLWTDINKDNPATHNHLKHSMADYTAIEEFSTHRAYVLHQQALARMGALLGAWQQVTPEERVVIVTHHAPTPRSIHPKYENDFHMNGGFASDLSAIMDEYPQITNWFHGHMHDPSDYVVNKTRVACHPRGYFPYEPRSKDYRPLEVEL